MNVDIEEYEALDIKYVELHMQSNLPTHSDIEAAVGAILESKDEYLCTLIFSEDVENCLCFVVAYLVCRYSWSLPSSIEFVDKKLYGLGLLGLKNYFSELK